MASILPFLPLATSALQGFFASEGQEDTNVANRQNAQAQMDFQERMSNTAHQREVKDLIAAGLNPMLSAKLGGASSPAGAMSVNQNPAAAGTKAFSESMQSAGATAGIQLTQAQTAKTEAEKDLAEASTAEVRERTGTHPQNIAESQQRIAESRERIQEIIQSVKTGAATEDNLRQTIENAKELIPQIRATVEQLKAQTKLTGTQMPLAAAQTAHAYASAGLAGAQKGETVQRTAANLPALEAAIGNLDRVIKQMSLPHHQREEAMADSPMGVILNAMEKVARLLPFSGVIANFPKTETPAVPGRKDWKK